MLVTHLCCQGRCTWDYQPATKLEDVTVTMEGCAHWALVVAISVVVMPTADELSPAQNCCIHQLTQGTQRKYVVQGTCCMLDRLQDGCIQCAPGA